MKKFIPVGLVLAALLLVTVSCASSNAPSRPTVAPQTTTMAAYSDNKGSSGAYPPTTYTQAAPTTSAPPRSTIAPMPAPTPVINVPPSGGAAAVDRMVVRDGNLQIVVKDVAGTIDNIAKFATDFGGFVVASQKWKDGERNMGTISIRILAENYDKAITSIRALAMTVMNETSNSQDVTQEYVDLDSRVKTLEATETQLLKIMETATKTEDVLSIQRELTSVRGQIEQAQGRMLYLQRTSSTSLLTIQLNEAVLDLKFSADKIMVNTGDDVHFTSDVSGGFTPYNYLWDFGDGKTSVEKSPAHGYADSGNYSVTLKVTDDRGYTNSLTRSQYITVEGNWSPADIAKGAWGGFAAFGRVMVNIFIWVGIFSPLWIVILGIIWLTYWRKRKKN